MKFTITTPLCINQLGKRSNQEDAIYPQEGVAGRHDRLFVVCDGMGGYEKGEVASRAVTETLGQWFSRNALPGEVLTDDQLAQAITEAYVALDAKGAEGDNRMGTTLALLYFHRGGAIAAHIGDSRIYHIRPVGRQVLYKSRDHSEMNTLPHMPANGNSQVPRKNVVTKAMTPAPSQRCMPDVAHITDIKAGDYFYLCSDGMLEKMCDEELVDILTAGGSEDRQKVNRLITATADNNDNHSAYLITIESVTSELGDERYINDERSKSDTVSPLLNGKQEEQEDVIDVIDGPASPQLPPVAAAVPPVAAATAPAVTPQPISAQPVEKAEPAAPEAEQAGAIAPRQSQQQVQQQVQPQVARPTQQHRSNGPVARSRAPKKQQNKWLIPAIAAAVVLISGLVAMLLLSKNDDKPATGSHQQSVEEVIDHANGNNTHQNVGGGTTNTVNTTTTTHSGGKKHNTATQSGSKPSNVNNNKPIDQNERDRALNRAAGSNDLKNNLKKPDNNNSNNTSNQLRRGAQEVKPTKPNKQDLNRLNNNN